MQLVNVVSKKKLKISKSKLKFREEKKEILEIYRNFEKFQKISAECGTKPQGSPRLDFSLVSFNVSSILALFSNLFRIFLRTSIFYRLFSRVFSMSIVLIPFYLENSVFSVLFSPFPCTFLWPLFIFIDIFLCTFTPVRMYLSASLADQKSDAKRCEE